MMSRRKILQRLLATGAIATTSVSGQFIQLAVARPSNYELKVLSKSQAGFVGTVADVIIPATVSPSATDVGVVEFIDFMLSEWYSDRDVTDFLFGLGIAMRDSANHTIDDYVAGLDAAAFADGSASRRLHQFYRILKQIILIGFFTSEEAMTQCLNVAGPVGEFDFESTGAPGAGIRF